jgi:hypothetical protein
MYDQLKVHMTYLGYHPSTLTMYTTMLFAAYAIRTPSVATRSQTRTLAAVMALIAGATLGWPSSLLIGLPFIIEETFVK